MHGPGDVQYVVKLLNIIAVYTFNTELLYLIKLE